MSTNTEDISKSLRVAGMFPLDDKTIIVKLDDLKDLGTASSKAFTYYDGLRVFCLENRQEYEWKELAFGDTGLIPQSYSYPPSIEVNGVDYSGKVYNFVPVKSNSTGTNLVYYEPSVNVEFKEEQTLVEAMYFGRLDIGGGVEDVALVSTSFASQSNFDLLNGINVGAEIKMFNYSNGKYLGHFTISNTTFSGYRVLTIIEKGEWAPIGTYPIQEILISVLKEAPYSISLSANSLIMKKGNTQINTVDLSGLVAVGGASITNAVFDDNTGLVTFTLSDASTFQLDLSALLVAETTLKRSSLLSPNGNTIYENLFVTKATQASFGKGFYAADLNTNYNAGNFLGFPYPSSRDYLMVKYESNFYMLVRKAIAVGKRVFSEPNNVLAFSFFKYSNNTDKSMIKVAYPKILTRKTSLTGLSADWWAFPLWNEAGNILPQSVFTAPLDEGTFITGTNESEAYPLVNFLYKESLPLRKTVTAPYTIKEEDHGLVLFILGSGNVTVPKLAYGFECGLIQGSSSSNEITIIAGTGVSIVKSESRSSVLLGQYLSAYLFANEDYTHTGFINNRFADKFVLMGDLKKA